MKTIPFLALLLSAFTTAHAQNLLQPVWTTNIHSTEYVASLAFSGDSKRLASAAIDGYVNVWSVTTNVPVRSIYTRNGGFGSVALNSDGSLVGAGSGDASRMWSVSDGRRLWIAGESSADDLVEAVALSPNDLWFADATRSRRYINIRNMLSGTGGFLEGHSGRVVNLVFSPDSTKIASASLDGSAILWNFLSGATFQKLLHPNAVRSVDFSPDGNVFATGCDDNRVRLWNVTNGTPLLTITNTGALVKFLGDGSYLMSLEPAVSHQFKIFRASDGKYMGGYTNTDALCFAVSRDGRYFAFGNSSGIVTLAWSPLINEGFTRKGRQTILHWSGGSGYYQVQRRKRERGTHWRNWRQPTTATSARVSDRPHFAYRVISLPPPP